MPRDTVTGLTSTACGTLRIFLLVDVSLQWAGFELGPLGEAGR